VPGRADILLAAGGYLDDGTPLDPMASFATASLGHSIVAEIGMKLVADGTLDPDATIDPWLADAPNAERITVGMLVDATHVWGDDGEVLGQNVTADLERRWTSAEAVATLQDVARGRAGHVRGRRLRNGHARPRVHRRAGHRPVPTDE
jgi:CubicO group peptidase (beta-lactamase class C family)